MPADPTNAQLRRQTKKETDEFPFKVSGHAREIEQKRARGEISCAECRRLKIKCSKEIPCQSCIRRGCRSICPQGSLATGEGTRYVLAATEHLHKRISKLSSRVRELEDALATVHRENSDEPHPLLRTEVNSSAMDEDTGHESLGPNDSENPPSDSLENFGSLSISGTLSISEHGVSRFFGATAGSEVLLMSVLNQDEEESPANSPSPPSAHADSGLPSTVTFFSRSFPFTPLGSTHEVRNLVESYLPSWDRAHQLCNIYFSEISWLIKSVIPSQVFDDMLPVIYRKKESIPGEEYDTPHHLSLLFVILALGALVEGTVGDHEGFNNLQEAEHYHQIAKAALPLQPVLEKPSIYAIQTLHLMSIYIAMSGEDLSSQNSMEMTWNLVTLASHLAQTIGLHRDSSKWGLSDKMTERRRSIFWDIYTADTWNSLTTGRPPSFTLAYIDCKLPDYPGNLGKETNKLAFENWAFKFATDCVSEVAGKACSATTPTYEVIMELDKKVREYPLPDLTGRGKPDMVVNFQKCICEHIRETVLLYIHRSFFAQAILDEPSNPLKSTYAPSFLATYRASAQILRAIRDQYALFPIACARWWIMWGYAFSAAVVFGMVVTKGPRSPLANAAMKELDDACVLFSKVATSSRRAAKVLPILARLNTKARAAMTAAKEDPQSNPSWSFDDEYDELSIFAGHTRLLSNKQQVNQDAAPGGHSIAAVPLSLPVAPMPYSNHQPHPSPPHHNSPGPDRPSSHFSFPPPTQDLPYIQHGQPPAANRTHRELPQLRTFSPWPAQQQMSAPSPHNDVPVSVPTPISATGRQGTLRRYGSSQDLRYGWPADNLARTPQDDHRRPSESSLVHPSPSSSMRFDYPIQPQPMQSHAFAGHSPSAFTPLQGYGGGGHDRPPPSPMDLASMGIASANSRLDERFLSFMTDSGLLADDSQSSHQGQRSQNANFHHRPSGR